MARIRTIKPEFWTDSKTGTWSEFSKCLFLGLLNHADDYGVLRWEPFELRSKIFPYHSDTTHGAVQKAMLDEILPSGLVRIFGYTNDDAVTKMYLHIVNFERHQIVNRPSKPLLNGWLSGDTLRTYADRHQMEFEDLDSQTLIDGSVNTHGTLIPGKEGKGKEGMEWKGKGVVPPSAADPSFEETKKPNRGDRPTLDDVRAYCAERGNSVDPEKFFDFYTANGWVQGRAGKPIKNWQAAVRTWEKNRFGSSPPASSAPVSRVPTDEDLANWRP